MSKSIKLKNDNYWDSSSIVHNKKTIKDMVEDITGSRNGGLAKKKIVGNINLDDLRTEGTGLYVADIGCTNTPLKEYDGNTNWHWYIIQINYYYTYAVQIAISVHSDYNHIYMRHCIAGNWRGWLKVTLS